MFSGNEHLPPVDASQGTPLNPDPNLAPKLPLPELDAGLAERSLADLLNSSADPTDIFRNLREGLKGLPSDPTRYGVCKGTLDSLGEELRRSSRVKLRYAMLMNLMAASKWMGPDGACIVADRSKFVKEHLESRGLGFSPAQVSRTDRAGAVALQVADTGRPVGDSAEPFVALVRLPNDEAFKLAVTLLDEGQGTFPRPALLKERVDRRRAELKLNRKLRKRSKKPAHVPVKPVTTAFGLLGAALRHVNSQEGLDLLAGQLKEWQADLDLGQGPGKPSEAFLKLCDGKFEEVPAPAPRAPEVPTVDGGSEPERPGFTYEAGGLRLERYAGVVQVALIEADDRKGALLQDYCLSLGGVVDNTRLFCRPVSGARWRIERDIDQVRSLVKQVCAWAKEQAQTDWAGPTPETPEEGGDQ